MRISSSTINRYATQDMMKYQSEIAELQSQISSGKKLNKPSDDPVNAARQVNLTQSLSQIDQYNRNINIAEARLSNEETYIANSENTLLRVRELGLISNNSATSPEVYPAIATELKQLRDNLLSQANAIDPDGNFVFSGTMTSTRPFSPGGSQTYHGDSQPRLIQINQSLQTATNDSGSDVFLKIPTTDQSHSVSSEPANTGGASLVLTADGAVANISTDKYRIEFPTPDTYNIINESNGNTEISGAVLPPSNSIEHAGFQISLTGIPAANDVFKLEPVTLQDVFTTIDNFIGLLETPPVDSAGKAQHRQKLNEILTNVDQAFEHMTLKRAEVGNRLASLNTVRQENEDTGYQLTVMLSGIEDLDYADAISKLEQRAVALEALQRTITRTQGLSLFNS